MSAVLDGQSSGSRSVTLPALDGFELGARLRSADTHETVVVIHGATAVPSRFYDDFAAFFQASGWTALTYDYRGIGASRPQRLRGFPARARDWALSDVPGAIRWARDELKPRRLFCVGHSFGGQVMGLLQRPEQVDAMVTLSSQSGYWRVQGDGERLRAFLMVALVLPAVSRLLGYFPWSKLAKGEDLPAGVAIEWAGWCRRRRYLLDDRTLPLDRFARFSAPILAYSVADDGWGTARSVDEMMSAYPNVERRHLIPAEHALPAIGHMGFFRPSAAVLWPIARDWLDRSRA